MSEYQRLTYPAPKTPPSAAMSCTEFAARVIEFRQARFEQEAKAEAEKQKREEAARKRHLTSVMKQADTIWTRLDPLMDQKIASAYDEVAVHRE